MLHGGGLLLLLLRDERAGAPALVRHLLDEAAVGAVPAGRAKLLDERADEAPRVSMRREAEAGTMAAAPPPAPLPWLFAARRMPVANAP